MYFWMASCVHFSLKARGRCTIRVGSIWVLCLVGHNNASQPSAKATDSWLYDMRTVCG